MVRSIVVVARCTLCSINATGVLLLAKRYFTAFWRKSWSKRSDSTWSSSYLSVERGNRRLLLDWR